MYPAEIVLLGGLIFNDDGTVTLGTADAGAQITFTNVNAVDPNDEAWVERYSCKQYIMSLHIRFTSDINYPKPLKPFLRKATPVRAVGLTWQTRKPYKGGSFHRMPLVLPTRTLLKP